MNGTRRDPYLAFQFEIAHEGLSPSNDDDN